MSEHAQERRVRQREDDLHRARIRHAHRLDHPGGAPQEAWHHGIGGGRAGRAREEHALEAGRHRGGGQGGPVVETHAVPQTERPRETVAGHLPLRGQPGLDVARSLAVLQQRVEHLPRQQPGGRVRGECGIHAGGQGRHRHPEHAALRTDEARAEEHRQDTS